MEGLVKLRLTRVSGVNETLRLVVQMVICGHSVVYMCFTVPDL